MRVLIVSWHFPPVNAIAAVRVGKLARHLLAAGHDVRVVTAGKPDPDRSLPLEIDPDRVTATAFLDLDRVLNPKSWLSRRTSASAAAPPPVAARRGRRGRSLARSLGRLYAALVLYPDRQAGWLVHLVPALRRAAGISRPDLLLASGPPFSTFLGVALAARLLGVPWVAEFRDRWVDDPYFAGPAWRRPLDGWLERIVVGSASGIVTVSEPWARFYAAKYGLPTAAVMNGYDPADFAFADGPDPAAAASLPVRVLHAGTVYADRRDPTALFRAIVQGRFDPGEVRAVFYGKHFEYLERQVRACGVEDFVETHPPVPWPEAVRLQAASDVLLLMQWNDPEDRGNVPGKLFEYFAVRRPILGLGPVDGIPARLIRERAAGLHSNDPGEIAGRLRAWVEEKQRAGRVARLPESAREGLTRDAQYDVLQDFLARVVADEVAPRAPAADAAPGDACAVAGALAGPGFAPADTARLPRPTLVVIVDAEADFDWGGPFTRADHRLDSVHQQRLADDIFARFGVRPTYLVDYPLAASPEASAVLRGLRERGRCELGVQLHPWTTPPLDELLSRRNSFPCNLPPDLQRAKLEALIDAARRNLGVEPLVFKAGRYGIGDVGLGLLEEAGLLVDTSVVPFTSFAAEGGPCFHGVPAGPFWFGRRRRLLELPVTRGLVGFVPPVLAPRLHRACDGGAGRLLRLPGIAARLGLFDRLTLSPEGNSLAELKGLTRALLARGQRLLTFSFHSPSLAPGNTPYTRDRAELDAFLARIDGYLEFFLGELGGASATAVEAHAMLCRGRREAASVAEGRPEPGLQVGPSP